jgi:putative FmdB family regulatory protein
MMYEYRCPVCESEEEIICKVAERHEQTCSRCGNKLNLKISAVYSQWVADCPTASKGKMCSD